MGVANILMSESSNIITKRLIYCLVIHTKKINNQRLVDDFRKCVHCK